MSAAVIATAAWGSTAGATVPGQNGSLIYTSNETRAVSGLYLADPSSGATKAIPDGNGFANSYGSFSPSGNRFAFVRGNDDIWLNTLPGDGLATRIPIILPGSSYYYAYLSDPIYTPDGQLIAFSSTDDLGEWSSLWTVPIEGGEPAPLGAWQGSGLEPAVSPDGRHYALVSSDTERHTCGREGCIVTSGPSRIHIVDETGKDEGQLVPDVSASQPSYSPDGSRIAFAGGTAGSYGIHTIKSDGTGLRRLAAGGHSPVYSPDGTKIAYSDDLGIYVMNADGSGSRLVVPGARLHLGDWQRKAPFLLIPEPGSRRVAVRTFGPGRLTLTGPKVRRVTKTVEASGRTRLPLRLRTRPRKRLAAGHAVHVRVQVRFAPKGALPNTVTKRLTLRR